MITPFERLDTVGTLRFNVPSKEWAVMPEPAKKAAYIELMWQGLNEIIIQNPECAFFFDVRELQPDAKDLLDPTKEPEVIGELLITLYKPLS